MQLRKRPTYEVLLKDTVLNPKDKIDLPNREATIVRKTQQLTRYDEADFLDLEKDNENIEKQKMQEANLKATAASSPGGSIAQTKALAESSDALAGSSDDPPVYKPPRNPSFGFTPRTRLRPARPNPKTIPAMASSSNNRPGPGSGPKAATAAAAAAAQDDTAVQFDLTVDDDMQDAYDETKKVLEEKEQSDLEKKLEIARQISQHICPHAATADQSYIYIKTYRIKER